MAGRLAAGHEDDIALAGVGIVVLEKEKLVDTVVLQLRNLDDGANGPAQVPLDDEVLLAAHLELSR